MPDECCGFSMSATLPWPRRYDMADWSGKKPDPCHHLTQEYIYSLESCSDYTLPARMKKHIT